MPGHIYSQTGKFAEAEKSFGDAAANELGYIHADSLYGTGHHGHNVHYLSTAYAFDGQYDKVGKTAARKPVGDLRRILASWLRWMAISRPSGRAGSR